MSTQKIKHIVNKLTPNQAKTKRILLGCYKEHVKSNFYKLYLIGDLKKFLDWGGFNNRVDGLFENLGNYTSDQLEEQIDKYLTNMLGPNNVKYRMKYNVIKIINFMEEFDMEQCNKECKEQINRYFDKLSKRKSLEDVFVELDQLFVKLFGNTLEYYETIYRNYIKRLINAQYKKWSRPKFQIVDKYGILEDIDKASKAMKRSVSDKYRLGGEIEGDEKLERLQKYIGESMDSVLKNDYMVIDSLLGSDVPDSKIKGIWFRIYTWMKNKKPSKVTRNGLIVLFLYLVTDSHLTPLIRRGLEKDIDIDPSLIRDKNSNVYKLMYDIIDNVAGMNNYRYKLVELVNPKLDFKNLFEFINSQKSMDINKDKIIEEIQKQTEGLSSNQQKEKIYKILKPYKKYFPITREIIESLI